MIDVIVAMGVGVLIGAFGVIAWALSAVNKDRGEKDDRDQAGKGNGPEDRKATEAVNTIRIYCKNNDIHDCVFNCAIRQVCRGYFRNLNVPMLWPEVEVPDD